MKKISPISEKVVCGFVIFLLSIIATGLLVKYTDKIILVITAYICIIFAVLSLIRLCYFTPHITIDSNRIKVFDFPLFATNGFYDKKRSLILYNSEIDLNEVEEIELVKLTKKERKSCIGYNHLFNKYLKFHLKSGKPKYIHIGSYSNYQIDRIIKLAKNETKE